MCENHIILCLQSDDFCPELWPLISIPLNILIRYPYHMFIYPAVFQLWYKTQTNLQTPLYNCKPVVWHRYIMFYTPPWLWWQDFSSGISNQSHLIVFDWLPTLSFTASWWHYFSTGMNNQPGLMFSDWLPTLCFTAILSPESFLSALLALVIAFRSHIITLLNL